ncbi:thiamine ABC transporter substrate-binding protein [Tsukamurella soli]|uniref:thiamine ABC transporter substrate-binding protein n=1 Tax=Tsukamurella soli TaxID=644556 RepID=UPI003622FE72
MPYTSPAAVNGADAYGIPGENRLTAVDYGDVCVNIDTRYFAAHDLPEPTGYSDLADPRYRGLTSLEDPDTASPGLAFLLGTIATMGDGAAGAPGYPGGWQAYWTKLKGNDVTVTSDWNTTYSTDFSGSSGKGPKPIVVSYASSPADEVVPGANGAPDTSPTKALLDTCFRQVEFAGVLRGAKNPEGAREFIDFLLSQQAQVAVPESMYVYPVTRGVPLPATWERFAPAPPHPATMAASAIAAGRDGWLRTWRTLMGR